MAPDTRSPHYPPSGDHRLLRATCTSSRTRAVVLETAASQQIVTGVSQTKVCVAPHSLAFSTDSERCRIRGRKEASSEADPCVFRSFNPVARLPGWLSQQQIHLQCRRPKLDPWVRKIPWRREWPPTPGFLPGASPGQRSLAGCSPRGRRKSDTPELLTTAEHRRQPRCRQFPVGSFPSLVSEHPLGNCVL